MPLLLNAILNTWCALLNVVNAFIVDRFGRIKIIVTGIVSSCPTPLLALAQRLANLSWMLQSGGVLSMCVVAALSAHYGNPENTNRAGSIAAVVWIFIFVTFYGSCVDATSFIYTSEIFPTKIRAQGVGFSLSGFFLTDAGESDCSTSRNAGHGLPHGLR